MSTCTHPPHLHVYVFVRTMLSLVCSWTMASRHTHTHTHSVPLISQQVKLHWCTKLGHLCYCNHGIPPTEHLSSVGASVQSFPLAGVCEQARYKETFNRLTIQREREENEGKRSSWGAWFQRAQCAL